MKEAARLKLSLPMLAGKKLRCYGDDVNGAPFLKDLKVGASGDAEVDIQPNGGFVLVQ
jgi:hypothetical protein